MVISVGDFDATTFRCACWITQAAFDRWHGSDSIVVKTIRWSKHWKIACDRMLIIMAATLSRYICKVNAVECNGARKWQMKMLWRYPIRCDALSHVWIGAIAFRIKRSWALNWMRHSNDSINIRYKGSIFVNAKRIQANTTNKKPKKEKKPNEDKWLEMIDSEMLLKC